MWGRPLQGTDVSKFRVGQDDGDGFAGVDGASAAHRHDDVGVLLPAKGDALLDIFDGRIGLDPAVDGVGNRPPCPTRR